MAFAATVVIEVIAVVATVEASVGVVALVVVLAEVALATAALTIITIDDIIFSFSLNFFVSRITQFSVLTDFVHLSRLGKGIGCQIWLEHF